MQISDSTHIYVRMLLFRNKRLYVKFLQIVYSFDLMYTCSSLSWRNRQPQPFWTAVTYFHVSLLPASVVSREERGTCGPAVLGLLPERPRSLLPIRNHATGKRPQRAWPLPRADAEWRAPRPGEELRRPTVAARSVQVGDTFLSELQLRCATWEVRMLSWP